jgi:uncharacterized YccA/Bax inhibitor family protein
MANPALKDWPVGPIVADDPDLHRLTWSKVASAMGVLLLALVGFGYIGWGLVPSTANPSIGWIIVPLLAAFGVAIWTIHKPELARFTGLLYAALEGLVVGAISHVYENYKSGVVIEAIGVTLMVLAVCAVLYTSKTVRVTPKFLRVTASATIGAVFFYGICILASWLGATPTFLTNAGLLGTVICLVMATIASMNFISDLDMIDRQIEAGADGSFAFYGAFAMLIAAVWVYLEMLRLFGRGGRR